MNVVERYLELALRLGRHADELVDAYFGPEEVRARVEAEAVTSPARLADDAAELRRELDFDDEARQRWLDAQVRALETIARKLDGGSFAYAEEVELVYGVRPRWYDETEFEQAHALLDEALPGSGTVAYRYARWLDETAIPVDKLGAALESVTEELRARTRELVGLPEGEEVEIELVENRRWSGFAHALGDLRGRVLVNTDLPFLAFGLSHFLTHEIYPGHHTEQAWKEAVLVQERGFLEQTIGVLWAPHAVVSEGIAELAEEILLGDDGQQLTSEHLRRLGIAYDPEIGSRVSEARRTLGSRVMSNLGLLKHERGAADDELLDYARRWSLQPEDRVKKMIASLEERVSPGYVVCYPEGYRLARGFVRGDVERFKQLLVEQLTPADLETAEVRD